MSYNYALRLILVFRIERSLARHNGNTGHSEKLPRALFLTLHLAINFVAYVIYFHADKSSVRLSATMKTVRYIDGEVLIYNANVLSYHIEASCGLRPCGLRSRQFGTSYVPRDAWVAPLRTPRDECGRG